MLNVPPVLPQVQPKAPLLQILRVAGAQEEVFTLKEVSCPMKCQVGLQPVTLAHKTVLPEKREFLGLVVFYTVFLQVKMYDICSLQYLITCLLRR